jgi:HSP20 family protein
MSNLTVRTDNKTQPATTTNNGWYPMRMMRELLGWDPFREMEPFLVAPERAFMPAFEVSENKDGYLFKADLPGIKESDVNISITGNRLLISGKRESTQEQKGATHYVYECSYGEFSRAFTLPDAADTEHVKAELTSGVLSLVIPKKAGAQTKQIPVQGSKPKS